MKKLVCRYAIVRFLPYQETEEFANIGIVLACPESGYFDFKLQSQRHGRVTAFFDDLDGFAYRHSVKIFNSELARIKELIGSRDMPADSLRSMFDALVHPREAIIRFGDVRSMVVEDPAEALARLFRYYVEREFVNHDYKEHILLKRVRALVQSLQLIRPFHAMNLGDEFASAQFPLVQTDESGLALKAIKPFLLNQVEPSKIISHGGFWVDRMRRLRKRQKLPPAVLFAVDGPPEEDSKRYEAYSEICSDLRGHDIEVIPTRDEQRIRIFAAA